MDVVVGYLFQGTTENMTGLTLCKAPSIWGLFKMFPFRLDQYHSNCSSFSISCQNTAGHSLSNAIYTFDSILEPLRQDKRRWHLWCHTSLAEPLPNGPDTPVPVNNSLCFKNTMSRIFDSRWNTSVPIVSRR